MLRFKMLAPDLETVVHGGTETRLAAEARVDARLHVF